MYPYIKIAINWNVDLTYLRFIYILLIISLECPQIFLDLVHFER